ncbi:MAG: hypothetical protein JSV27_10270 [Candidatus Bathyarchaeota archaeon]|nr:MAG: hypothetical protein JSV27_10270 [Candidatus Bathyarchaeota archaeon]
MDLGSLRDGDAVVTFDGFIFYVFGYEHETDRYHGFLKYVPEEAAESFDVDWLDIRWRKGDTTLVRPREIYSPEAYPKLIESFRRSFPDYLHRSEQLGRWMITVPRDLIAEVYMPDQQLKKMVERGASDCLEQRALELLELLSEASSLPMRLFGVHGSISLGTSHPGSDIDLSVYGSTQYRSVKRALAELEGSGLLHLSRGDRFERKRLNRGVFRGERFVVNATRLYSEINSGQRRCTPLGEAEVECFCSSASESMFRPAVYSVKECRVIAGEPRAGEASQVVSMIGTFRDVVAEGETLTAKGVLEEMSQKGMQSWCRVVVGSSAPGEYIDWNEP